MFGAPWACVRKPLGITTTATTLPSARRLMASCWFVTLVMLRLPPATREFMKLMDPAPLS